MERYACNTGANSAEIRKDEIRLLFGFFLPSGIFTNILGAGFKYFLFSSLFGEDSHLD